MAKFLTLTQGENRGMQINLDAVCWVFPAGGSFKLGDQIIHVSDFDMKLIQKHIERIPSPFND